MGNSFSGVPPPLFFLLLFAMFLTPLFAT